MLYICDMKKLHNTPVERGIYRGKYNQKALDLKIKSLLN